MIAKPVSPAVTKVQLPALTQIEIRAVQCVVHYDPPTAQDEVYGFIEPGVPWIVAKLDLLVDRKTTPAVNERGDVVLPRELIRLLPLLQFSFEWVDRAGTGIGRAHPRPDQGDLCLEEVPGIPQARMIRVDSAKCRSAALDVDIEQHPGTNHARKVHVAVSSATDLFCCRDGKQGLEFPLRTRVELNAERARKLLCSPCDEGRDGCQAAFSVATHPAVRKRMALLASSPMPPAPLDRMERAFVLAGAGTCFGTGISTFLTESWRGEEALARALNAYCNRRLDDGAIDPAPSTAWHVESERWAQTIARLQSFASNELVPLDLLQPAASRTDAVDLAARCRAHQWLRQSLAKALKQAAEDWFKGNAAPLAKSG